MRRVIFSRKGGVGKTSITCNLAAVAADRGKKTLVVDLDPQCNATHYLVGTAAEALSPTLFEFYEDVLYAFLIKRKPIEFVHETPFKNLYLLPARPEMNEQDAKLESRYKVFQLREALDGLTGFDEIFIDTPPALNFFTRSALIAADACLIPFDCDEFSRKVLYSIIEVIRNFRIDHNERLTVEGIVVNQFQLGANYPRRVVSELKAEGLPVFDAMLSATVKIRESHAAATPVIYLDPQHKAAGEYRALYDALTGA